MRYNVHILNASKNIVAYVADAEYSFSETLNVDDTLQLRVYDQDKFSSITAEGTFVRLINPDDATDFRTYRINEPVEIHEEGRYELSVSGHRIWHDLGREMYGGYKPFSGTKVSSVFVEALKQSPKFQIKSGGNAESDTTEIEYVDLSYDFRANALQKIAQQAGLEIELDESTSPPSIDLKTRGANNGVTLTYGLNLPGIKRKVKRGEVANRIFPVGGGEIAATCKGALFKVQSVSTVTVTVKGDRCIPSDDTYIGDKIEMVTGAQAGVQYDITDTTRGATPDTDTIVSDTDMAAAGVVAGDLFKFVAGAGSWANYAENAELDFVPDQDSIDTYGEFDGRVERTDIIGIRSLISSAFFDGTYSGTLHTGWSKINGAETTSENTDVEFIEFGSSSQKVVATADGHGIKYTVSLDTNASHHSAKAHVFVASGSVAIAITGTNGGTTYTLKSDGSSGTDVFHDIELNGMPLEGTTATFKIYAVDAAATFYVDAVSFVAEQQTRDYVRENGARELYRAAFERLDETKSPVIEYTIPDVIDFYNANSMQYPYHQINIGDTVRVIDTDLGLDVSVRVLTLSRSSRHELASLTLSTHTKAEAAFNSLTPSGALANRYGTQRAIGSVQSNIKQQQSQTGDANHRIQSNAPMSSLRADFSGTFTATGQTAFDISAGTLRIGDAITFEISSQSESGLTANTLYYLYFDPAASSSGVQYTTSVATAFAGNNVTLGQIKTGATSIDFVRMLNSGGYESQSEIRTAGVEAFDDSGVKRVDIGILDNPSYGSGINPGDWGMQLNDGVFYQNAILPAFTTGGEPGYLRTLYGTFGDEDENGVYDSTTKRVVMDYVFGAGKFAGGVGSSFGIHGRETSLTVVAGSDGLAWGNRVSGSNAGTGDIVGFVTDTLTQSGGTGDAIGVAVGGYGVFGAGVRATGASGDAYGIYIKTVSSANGSAYSIYDASGADSYFAGDMEVAGTLTASTINFDSGDVAGALRARGTTSFASNAGVIVDYDTTGTPFGRVWSYDHGASAYKDLVVVGANIYLGNSGTYYAALSGGTTFRPYTDGGTNLGSATYRWGTVFADTIGDTGQTLTVAGSVNFDSGTLFVDHANDRVGVGTTSPDAKFEVAGNNSTTIGSNIDLWVSGGNSLSAYAQIGLGYNGGQTNPPTIIAYDVTNSSTFTYGDIVFYTRSVNTDTAPSERMRIASDGAVSIANELTVNTSAFHVDGITANVGVGTTSPDAKFEVAGNNSTTIGSNIDLWVSGGNTLSAYAQIGLGYNGGQTNPPTIIAYDVTNSSTFTYGDIVFYTRSVNTDTAPSERMRITSAGNIGIGTTGPSGDLHIVRSGTSDAVISYGTAASGGNWSHGVDYSNSGAWVLANDGGGLGSFDRLIIATDGNSTFYGNIEIEKTLPILSLKSTSSGTNSSQIYFYENTSTLSAAIVFTNATNLFSIGTQVAGNVNISTNNTVAITVDTSQNTTAYGNVTLQKSGDAILSVKSTSTTNISTLRFYENTSTLGASVEYDHATENLFVGTETSNGILELGVNSSPKWAINQSGHLYPGLNDWYDLGLSANRVSTVYAVAGNFSGTVSAGKLGLGGITSPDTHIHITHSSSGSDNGIKMANSSGSTWGMGELVFNNTFSIYHFGSTDGKLNIKSDGDVGIGTQTPNYRLHVAKNTGTVVNIEHSASSGFGSGNLNCLRLNYSAATPGAVSDSFIFGVDSTATRFNIYANGDMYNANGTYAMYSDQRLKTNITTARSYWDDYQDLRWVKFQKIEDYYIYGDDAPYLFGLVAQEVEEVFPGCVSESFNGYKSVKNSVIAMIQGAVLQEAQARIVKAESTLNTHTSEIDQLRARVSTLEDENTALKKQVADLAA